MKYVPGVHFVQNIFGGGDNDRLCGSHLLKSVTLVITMRILFDSRSISAKSYSRQHLAVTSVTTTAISSSASFSTSRPVISQSTQISRSLSEKKVWIVWKNYRRNLDWKGTRQGLGFTRHVAKCLSFLESARSCDGKAQTAGFFYWAEKNLSSTSLQYSGKPLKHWNKQICSEMSEVYLEITKVFYKKNITSLC